MDDVISYIDEYSEQTINEFPLCEVDFLIFAQISYLNLGGIVPRIMEERKKMSLRELLVHPASSSMFLEKWFGLENMQLLQAMTDGVRYREVALKYFSEVNDIKRETQFAAVTVILPGGAHCITFRGTDESLIGWKEDCNLTFLEKIPAQELAASYLRMVAARTQGTLYLVGHSKGGNLAEYAAVHAPDAVRYRIREVYNYDGPGNPCAVNRMSTQQEEDKTKYPWTFHKYITRSSLIGSLFDEVCEGEMIESHGIGIMQHNPYNWVIMHGQFVRIAKNERIRRSVPEELLRRWIFRMEIEERKKLIDHFFELMTATGASDFTKMELDWKNCMWKFLVALREKHGEMQ